MHKKMPQTCNLQICGKKTLDMYSDILAFKSDMNY